MRFPADGGRMAGWLIVFYGEIEIV
jgi:hypothetical protein